MNILFLADNFPPERNAQASRVYERACYWLQWGHRVTVITCAPNFPEGKVFPGYRNRWYAVERMSGIRVIRVKTFIAENRGTIRRTLDFLSYMLSSFIAGLVQDRPDLIVATSPQFFAAISGCALSAVRHVPFVFELSDLWPDSIAAVGAMKRCWAFRVVEKIELFLYHRSAAVIALTGAFKENLVRRGIPEQKIAVVLNGVDLRRYKPRERDKALAEKWGLLGRFVVGYIGTLGMAHALENVLDAAVGLVSTDVHFILVGPGARRRELMAEAHRRKLPNVTIVDPQAKGDVPAYWSLCDVALVHLRNAPTFKTVLPSKMFEAMGMGLPILLAAPDGEASRLTTAERVGICVPPEDPRRLAEAVLLLRNNAKLRAQFAAASRLAASAHSRERQAREMLAVLERVAVFSVPVPAPALPERASSTAAGR